MGLRVKVLGHTEHETDGSYAPKGARLVRVRGQGLGARG